MLQKTKARLLAATAAASAFVVSAAAHAEIDASVTTAMAQVKADATELSGIVTPIVIAIMGLGIVIKLIKRFGNKV